MALCGTLPVLFEVNAFIVLGVFRESSRFCCLALSIPHYITLFPPWTWWVVPGLLVSRQDTVIRKMNWGSCIYLCLFASSAEPRARQIMDDLLLSKPCWNGDKWLGVGAKRNRTVLEKHFDRWGFSCIGFYNWHHRGVSRSNLLALHQGMAAIEAGDI